MLTQVIIFVKKFNKFVSSIKYRVKKEKENKLRESREKTIVIPKKPVLDMIGEQESMSSLSFPRKWESKPFLSLRGTESRSNLKKMYFVIPKVI
jgi:hypothetical protein